MKTTVAPVAHPHQIVVVSAATAVKSITPFRRPATSKSPPKPIPVFEMTTGNASRFLTPENCYSSYLREKAQVDIETKVNPSSPRWQLYYAFTGGSVACSKCKLYMKHASLKRHQKRCPDDMTPYKFVKYTDGTFFCYFGCFERYD